MADAELMYAPDSDRVVLAVSDLHMRWVDAGKTFSVEMVADVAKNWGIGDEDTDELEIFLSGFVMDLRSAQDSGGYPADPEGGF